MPTKRSGKASRRSRQRPPRRPVIPQPAPRPASPASDETDSVAVAPISTEPAPPAVRPLPQIYAGASRLSERAAAEYHYVGRDLRNIAVLTAIIAVILIAAWLILPATGLISR
jgi:hypothetical protein